MCFICSVTKGKGKVYFDNDLSVFTSNMKISFCGLYVPWPWVGAKCTPTMTCYPGDYFASPRYTYIKPHHRDTLGEDEKSYLEYDKMFGGYCKKTETLKAEWHDRFRQWIPTECLDGTHKYQNSLKKGKQDIFMFFSFLQVLSLESAYEGVWKSL